MTRFPCLPFFAVAAAALSTAALPGCGSVVADDAVVVAPLPPHDALQRDWADDPIWHDGLSEIARYEAVRAIYGTPRPYTATIMTNKENLDLDSRTKSSGGGGPVVFKHHVRDESIPTPKYRYDFSTMAYVDAATLGMWKLEMGSQEDCGATFKQYWNDGSSVEAMQGSYFPNEGVRTASYDTPEGFVYHDALPLILRGFPFDDPPDEPIRLQLLVDQTYTRLSSAEPAPYVVTYKGRETLELPVGTVEAHHLVVSPVRRSVPPPGGEASHYWFAADGTPPMLHALVQYRGPFGTEYRLASHERGAYWR